MSPDALDTLRQVNDYLRSTLIRLRPERKHCSAIRPQDFSDLLTQVLRASQCLRTPPHVPAALTTESALHEATLEYRGNLEDLQRFLPDLQARLLAEKGRLEIAKTHVAAAAEWDRAAKKAL